MLLPVSMLLGAPGTVLCSNRQALAGHRTGSFVSTATAIEDLAVSPHQTPGTAAHSSLAMLPWARLDLAGLALAFTGFDWALRLRNVHQA